MKFWSSSYSSGYSQKMKLEEGPEDWSFPSRIIWEFPYDTIRSSPQSPYAYHLHSLMRPFLRLSFSISRFLQFYEEYREYVLSQPALYHQFKMRRLENDKRPLTPEQQQFSRVVRDFNHRIHVGTIGGEDSPEEECLYKAHRAAYAALNDSDRGLKVPELPRAFWIGHLMSALSFLSGLALVYKVAAR